MRLETPGALAMPTIATTATNTQAAILFLFMKSHPYCQVFHSTGGSMGSTTVVKPLARERRFCTQLLTEFTGMAKGGMATNPLTSICVYCGSSPGNDPDYLDSGRILGRAIGEAGLRLVYGGGTKGIMGAVADGTMEAGGKVIGIIPRFLMNKEATEKALGVLDELVVTEDMHERKHRMFEEADAFVTLPGGIGTLEEVIEIMTWAQLGRHTKPIVLANINGFWDPLSMLIDHMRDAGFIHTGHRVQPLVVNSAQEIVPAILAAREHGEGDEKIIERM
jgi:hypothetical protein